MAVSRRVRRPQQAVVRVKAVSLATAVFVARGRRLPKTRRIGLHLVHRLLRLCLHLLPTALFHRWVRT